MEQYEIIKEALGWIPILLVFIVFIFVRNLKWRYRYLIVAIIGWVIIFISTKLILDYSFHYAPTQEIKHEVAMHDGAPVAFSFLFGWAYALILMLIFDTIHKVYLYFRKKYLGIYSNSKVKNN